MHSSDSDGDAPAFPLVHAQETTKQHCSWVTRRRLNFRKQLSSRVQEEARHTEHNCAVQNSGAKTDGSWATAASSMVQPAARSAPGQTAKGPVLCGGNLQPCCSDQVARHLERPTHGGQPRPYNPANASAVAQDQNLESRSFLQPADCTTTPKDPARHGQQGPLGLGSHSLRRRERPRLQSLYPIPGDEGAHEGATPTAQTPLDPDEADVLSDLPPWMTSKAPRQPFSLFHTESKAAEGTGSTNGIWAMHSNPTAPSAESPLSSTSLEHERRLCESGGGVNAWPGVQDGSSRPTALEFGPRTAATASVADGLQWSSRMGGSSMAGERWEDECIGDGTRTRSRVTDKARDGLWSNSPAPGPSSPGLAQWSASSPGAGHGASSRGRPGRSRSDMVRPRGTDAVSFWRGAGASGAGEAASAAGGGDVGSSPCTDAGILVLGDGIGVERWSNGGTAGGRSPVGSTGDVDLEAELQVIVQDFACDESLESFELPAEHIAWSHMGSTATPKTAMPSGCSPTGGSQDFSFPTLLPTPELAAGRLPFATPSEPAMPNPLGLTTAISSGSSAVKPVGTSAAAPLRSTGVTPPGAVLAQPPSADNAAKRALAASSWPLHDIGACKTAARAPRRTTLSTFPRPRFQTPVPAATRHAAWMADSNMAGLASTPPGSSTKIVCAPPWPGGASSITPFHDVTNNINSVNCAVQKAVGIASSGIVASIWSGTKAALLGAHLSMPSAFKPPAAAGLPTLARAGSSSCGGVEPPVPAPSTPWHQVPTPGTVFSTGIRAPPALDGIDIDDEEIEDDSEFISAPRPAQGPGQGLQAALPAAASRPGGTPLPLGQQALPGSGAAPPRLSFSLCSPAATIGAGGGGGGGCSPALPNTAANRIALFGAGAAASPGGEWWRALPNFVPVAALLPDMRDPRNGERVYIDYRHQFGAVSTAQPGSRGGQGQHGGDEATVWRRAAREGSSGHGASGKGPAMAGGSCVAGSSLGRGNAEGAWRTEATGSKVYIDGAGKKHIGQAAFRKYKRFKKRKR